MQAVEHYIEKFVPEHYDLFLDLSRETKTFSGKVTITGQAKSDRISLHQKDLEIASVEVAGQARPFTVDNENEELGQRLLSLLAHPHMGRHHGQNGSQTESTKLPS